jgi:subtilisin family serine protease
MNQYRKWFLLIGAVLGIVLCALGFAQTTIKDQPLRWIPTEDFQKLQAGVDYAANQVIAIYKPKNRKEYDLIRKEPKAVNSIAAISKIAAAAKVRLIEAIAIPPRANDVNGAASQVCGQIILRFSTEGNPVGSTATSFPSNDFIYGVAPFGFGLPSQTQSKDTENIWGLKAVQALEKSNQGKGLRVAVLDTGVTRIHALNMIPGANFVYPESPTLATNDDFAPAPEGHGTGVAGIIGGSSANGLPVGVAPSSSISPVKVCRADGRCTDPSVVMGVCFAVSKSVQAKVLNVSLGSFINSPILEGAIRDANLEKALVVASAGNTREFTEPNDPRRNLPVFPAAFSNDPRVNLVNLMSIGAIDPDMNYAWFATAHKSVDMVAPGVEIRTYSRTESAYVNADGGTSYAAPYVSGTAALMFSKTPSLFPAQVKEILKKTADPSGCNQVDPVDSCGAGLLNVDKALINTP